MAKDKGGRPTVMTESTIAKLKEGFELDFTILQACLHAEIDEATYYRWKQDNESKAISLEACRHNMKMKAKRILNKSLDEENSNDAKWLLERREKEGYSIRQEVTGADGEEFKITWNETKTYDTDTQTD